MARSAHSFVIALWWDRGRSVLQQPVCGIRKPVKLLASDLLNLDICGVFRSIAEEGSNHAQPAQV